MLVAFILNICFSILEFFVGMLTGSVAIKDDAIHDMGDAISIAISYFLEKKSKGRPDKNYTYGYLRYSILGAVVTNFILLVSSIVIIYNAIERIINPVEIHHNNMILFACFAIIVNFIALLATKKGKSLNAKVLNLHMLEDMLGWIVILIGGIIIKFSGFLIIDPIMSGLVAFYIFIHSLKSFKNIIDVILEKTPRGIEIEKIKSSLLSIDGISDIHHIHVWSIDGINNIATLHVVINNKDYFKMKCLIKEELTKENISHTTVEVESVGDFCNEIECNICNM